jgi:hypothetical protein
MKIRNNKTGEIKEVGDAYGLNLCHSQDYEQVVEKKKKENKSAAKRQTKEQK